jgi:hypothetical protein
VANRKVEAIEDAQTDFKKKEALKYGVEKLREMKKKME